MYSLRPRIILPVFLCMVMLSTCVSTTTTPTTSTDVPPINPRTSETEKALEAAQEAEGLAE
jgi:hypothetical protein